MRKELKMVYLISLLLLFLNGCEAGANEDNKYTSEIAHTTTQSDLEPVQTSQNNQSDMAKRAQDEGVSLEDMEQMIEELTELTAKKYGSTAQAYKAELESRGQSPYQVFNLAADTLGITIKEYLDYERSAVDNMSDEQKEIMQAMAAAGQQIENIDLSKLDPQVNQPYSVSTIDDGEIISIDYKTFGIFKSADIISEKDAYNTEGMYEITYQSTADVNTVIEHFSEQLKGASGYMMTSAPDASETVISCRVNGGDAVDIIITRDDKDAVTVEYLYMKF